MYLTRTKLNRADPGIRQCLRDMQDMHRSLMRLFGCERKKANVLFRITPDLTGMYVYSDVAPEGVVKGMEITGTKELTALLKRFEQGNVFAFDIITVPCKKIRVEGSKNSKIRFIKDEKERLEWFSGKGNAHGFQVLSIKEEPAVQVTVSHGKNGEIKYSSVRFTGKLMIEEPEAFLEVFQSGLGQGKAYGMGMLLLRG